MDFWQRWARATFFWVRNRNSATWRKHLRNRKSATFKEMLLRNRNSAIAIFSEVRNFKSATWALHFRYFRHIFCRGGYWEDFKGTVAQDFRFLFFVNTPYEPLSHTLQKIFEFSFNSQYPKFRVCIRNPCWLNSWEKKSEAKNFVLLSL